MFNGIDSIFITACCHIAAQFQIITMKIQNVLTKSDSSEASLPEMENREIRRKLIAIINEQIKLFEVTDMLIKVFTAIILMHFITVALIIGIGSINFLMVRFFYFFKKIFSFVKELLFIKKNCRSKKFLSNIRRLEPIK